jgi:hypothetical protein
MAHSARILALFQKIEAADAPHFARLRESAKKDTAARAATCKKRASLPVAQAVQTPSAKRKRPPRKKSPLGET